MKILVLGGTVFLGRHVVESALARGHSPAFLLMQGFPPGARTMRPRPWLKEMMATARSKPAPKRRLRLRFEGESRTYDQALSLARTTRRTGSRIGRAGSHRAARCSRPGARGVQSSSSTRAISPIGVYA